MSVWLRRWHLRAELGLGLGADDLGLLMSVYFLVFAAVVLPCGVLLDPRGAHVFALAGGVWTIMAGRALIGLGVVLALIAGLKAIVLWFPPQRIALANGFYVMLGALRSVSGIGPAALLVQGAGWRGLFAILAAASAAVALLSGLALRSLGLHCSMRRGVAGALWLALIRPAVAFHVVQHTSSAHTFQEEVR